MTVLNSKVTTRNSVNKVYAQVVPSASIWDLGAPGELNETYRNSSIVRTLPSSPRTPGREYQPSLKAPSARLRRIESRRERLSTLVAGAMMGMSIIFGAAVSGAFEPEHPQPSAPVDYVAEIAPTTR